MSNHRLVYSTESGRMCPRYGRPAARCGCKKHSRNAAPSSSAADGIVRIRRETHGRRGKTVSVIYGLPLEGGALNDLARALKQCCGTGGTLAEGAIVMQGDHRERLKEELQKRGYIVKLAGS